MRCRCSRPYLGDAEREHLRLTDRYELSDRRSHASGERTNQRTTEANRDGPPRKPFPYDASAYRAAGCAEKRSGRACTPATPSRRRPTPTCWPPGPCFMPASSSRRRRRASPPARRRHGGESGPRRSRHLPETSERLKARAAAGEVAARAEARSAPSRTTRNAHSLARLCARPLQPGISITKALSQGLGGRIRTLRDDDRARAEARRRAHRAFGSYHAEVIDKIGGLLGAPGARAETGLKMMFRRGCAWAPDR